MTLGSSEGNASSVSSSPSVTNATQTLQLSAAALRLLGLIDGAGEFQPVYVLATRLPSADRSTLPDAIRELEQHGLIQVETFDVYGGPEIIPAAAADAAREEESRDPWGVRPFPLTPAAPNSPQWHWERLNAYITDHLTGHGPLNVGCIRQSLDLAVLTIASVKALGDEQLQPIADQINTFTGLLAPFLHDHATPHDDSPTLFTDAADAYDVDVVTAAPPSPNAFQRRRAGRPDPDQGAAAAATSQPADAAPLTNAAAVKIVADNLAPVVKAVGPDAVIAAIADATPNAFQKRRLAGAASQSV